MNITDLKDGMLVEYRNGKTRYIIDSNLYSYDGYNMEKQLPLKIYTNDMLSIDECKDIDIMKISYMGIVLWERKEYVTFDEARRSGKRFKHKSWDIDVDYYSLSEAFQYLWSLDEQLANEYIDSKKWLMEN